MLVLSTSAPVVASTFVVARASSLVVRFALRTSEVTSVLRVLLVAYWLLLGWYRGKPERVPATSKPNPCRRRDRPRTSRAAWAARSPGQCPSESNPHTNVSGDGVLTIVMSSVPARPAAPQLHAQPSADGPVHRGFGFPRSPTAGGVPRPAPPHRSRACAGGGGRRARGPSPCRGLVSRVSRRLDRPCSD